MPAEAPWWVAGLLSVLSAVLPVVTFFLGQKFQVDRDRIAADRAAAERADEREAARDDRDTAHALEAEEKQKQREHEEALARLEAASRHRQELGEAFIEALQASQTMLESLRLAVDLRAKGDAGPVLLDRAAYRGFITALSRLRILNDSWSGWDQELAHLWRITTDGYVELSTVNSSAQWARLAIAGLEEFVTEMPSNFANLLELKEAASGEAEASGEAARP